MAAEDVDVAHGKDSNKGIQAKCRSFGRSIWNPDKHEFIGRTGASWAKIGLFYLVFYSCLAGFFAAMLAGFFATLQPNKPTQTGMYSLIKGNPGMGYRPRINVESTLIHIKPGDVDKLANSIDEILKPYHDQGSQVDCGGDLKSNASVACRFHLEQLGTVCTKENQYGYKDGQPCVLVKMNKVFDWQPTPYDYSAGNSSDQDTIDVANKLGDRANSSYVGVTCEGENDGDADNLGPVEFFPKLGFPISFFPYMNQTGYQAPLVFARFTRPRRGALIQVWCKLWARNIKHHKNDKAGSVHFEILLDVPK